MLGGGSIVKGKVITHVKKKEPVVTNRTISAQGLKNLCYYLCSEIQIYKLVLKRSVNLNETDRLLPLQSINETCPIETSMDETNHDC